jgi:holo-[acyl-carrier protein] synthase
MMLSNGVDIVDIRRIRRVLDRYGERFLKRVYTGAEIIICRRNAEALAARFSGKEAVMKTLGLRFLPWKDIEILPDSNG